MHTVPLHDCIYVCFAYRISPAFLLQCIVGAYTGMLVGLCSIASYWAQLLRQAPEVPIIVMD